MDAFRQTDGTRRVSAEQSQSSRHSGDYECRRRQHAGQRRTGFSLPQRWNRKQQKVAPLLFLDPIETEPELTVMNFLYVTKGEPEAFGPSTYWTSEMEAPV